jgi:hypothetical protein
MGELSTEEAREIAAHLTTEEGDVLRAVHGSPGIDERGLAEKLQIPRRIAAGRLAAMRAMDLICWRGEAEEANAD